MTIRNAANNNVKPTIFGKICGFEKFFRNLVTFRVLVRNRVHGDKTPSRPFHSFKRRLASSNCRMLGSTELKGVGLHYTAFRDAIREDSRQTTP